MQHETIKAVGITTALPLDIEDMEEQDLFADELDERYNAGTVSSSTCISSASCAGTSSASCACTASCLCTG